MERKSYALLLVMVLTTSLVLRCAPVWGASAPRPTPAPKPTKKTESTETATKAQDAATQISADDAALDKVFTALKLTLAKPFAPVKTTSTAGVKVTGAPALSDVLAILAKTAGVTMTLDPNLPKSIGDQLITISMPKGASIQETLGATLALSTPSLRYSITPAGIFIGTPPGVARHATKVEDTETAASATLSDEAKAAAKPMTDADILAAMAKAEGREIKWVHIDRTVYKVPGADQFAPSSTTETYSYTPPQSASWYYSSTPYFPRPEIMIQRENKGLTSTEKVNAIIRLMERNPTMTAQQILKMIKQ